MRQSQLKIGLSSLWKSEEKSGAFPYFTFCPNSPPMPKDNALDDRQSDAISLKFTKRMQALKGAE
jgi:hypothetical protein